MCISICRKREGSFIMKLTYIQCLCEIFRKECRESPRFLQPTDGRLLGFHMHESDAAHRSASCLGNGGVKVA